MSFTTVRAATVEFLNQPPIDGISLWFQDEPWFIAGNTWPARIGGSIGYVHIDSSEENRITVGGMAGVTPTGQKQVIHEVSLIHAYRYRIPSQTTPLQEDAWVGDQDAQLDGIVNRLRSDPTLGAPGVIFQAAQGQAGQADVRVTRDLPVTDPKRSSILSWTRIQFTAAEIITA